MRSPRPIAGSIRSSPPCVKIEGCESPIVRSGRRRFRCCYPLTSFVQMSDRRWYVFGLREDETSLTVYALDRILACEPTEKTFVFPETFSAGEYLRQHGIGQYEAIPETKVVVRAYGLMADRLRTLPLHPSQQETKTDAGWAEFTFTLRPTSRFFGELLACGAYVKVLSPRWVQQRMKETADKIAEYYK